MKPFYLTNIKGPLYLSNKVWLERDLSVIQSNEIGAIVNITEDHTYKVPPHIAYLHCGFPDQFYIPHEKLDEIYSFIDLHCLYTNVLVHCSAGVSRSAGIVIGQLMRENPSWTWEHAFNLVNMKRSIWVSVETRESVLAYLGYRLQLQSRSEIEEQDKISLQQLQVFCGHELQEVGSIGWDTAGYVIENHRIVGLGLNDLGLTVIPEPVLKMTALRNFYCCSNAIKTIPEVIKGLINLKNINLFGNFITSLPVEMYKLNGLRVLNVSKNALRSIPEGIEELPALNRFYLHENQLTYLPKGFSDLNNINELYLHKNQLKNLPETFGGLSTLQRLALDGNQLKNLPNSLGNLKRLKALNLSKNQIGELPDSIGELDQLENLNISSNVMVDLPNQIVELGNLMRLNIALNQFHEFSESVERWMEKLEKRGCYVIREGWSA